MSNMSVYQSVQELLKELQYLIEKLQKDTQQLSLLELDLLKEKIRRVYEKLNDIEINKSIDRLHEPVSTSENESIPEYVKTKPVESPSIFPEEYPEKAQNEIFASDSEEKYEAGKQTVTSTDNELNLFGESLTSSFKTEKKTIGEKIAEDKSAKSIGEVIKNKKMVSLKMAIGINEKFFFLNELFQGNLKQYNESIELLDLKNTFDEASECLAEMAEKKDWDKKSDAYLQLKALIQRKFN